MNIAKFFKGLGRYFSCLVLVISSCFYSSHAFADQISKYANSTKDYELVSARVLSFGRDTGVLRIFLGSCEDCYVDASFGRRVNLNTPLGHYYGLEKLADWSDRPMNISISEKTGLVVNVRIK